MIRRAALCLVLCAVCVGAGAGGPDIEGRLKSLPEDWAVEQSGVVPADQTAAIGQRLGGKLSKLTNSVLRYGDRRVRVNVLTAASEADAKAVQGVILKTKGNPAFCVRQRAVVVEFVGPDVALVRRAHYALGLRPMRATYRVRFAMAAVEQADYMKGNELSNALIALDDPGARTDAQKRVAALRPSFRFGNSLALRTLAPGGRAVQFTLEPKPAKSQHVAGGEAVTYTFDELPRRAGVPYVTIEATIPVRAFEPTSTRRKPGPELLAATAYWPSDDPAVEKLAAGITAGAETDAAKVEALLAWLMPGRNLRFAGDIVGSRYGAAKVLDQRFGHCWDFSDVFVTLARASGVPARQVAGWLEGKCGHVWAEVLLDGGWVQVDPTAGDRCGSDYIPWCVTEGGRMPLVYVTWPTIEGVEPR
jgi:hypothetical protein